MRILFIILFLAFCSPAFGAESAATDDAAPKTESGAQQPEHKNTEENAEAAPEGEYSCKYYTVKLPPDWKAIVPPTEQQGNINAIFTANSGNPVITMIVGPNGGADAKTIAGMFAEQFRAPKQPVEKNGVYVFSFTQQEKDVHAWVSVLDAEFMVVTCTGSQKEAQDFIKKNISSKEYEALLPK